MYIRLPSCTNRHTCTYLYDYLPTYTNRHTSTYVYTTTYLFERAHMYICIYDYLPTLTGTRLNARIAATPTGGALETLAVASVVGWAMAWALVVRLGSVVACS